MWSTISFNVFLLTFDSVMVFGLGFSYMALPIGWVASSYLSAAVQIGLSWGYVPVQRTLQPLDWAAFDEVLPHWCVVCGMSFWLRLTDAIVSLCIHAAIDAAVDAYVRPCSHDHTVCDMTLCCFFSYIHACIYRAVVRVHFPGTAWHCDALQ